MEPTTTDQAAETAAAAPEKAKTEEKAAPAAETKAPARLLTPSVLPRPLRARREIATAIIAETATVIIAAVTITPLPWVLCSRL